MRAKAGILIIFISFLFLVATVEAAGIPDTVTVTTNKPWIVANTIDQSTITVTVENTTSPDNGPVSGVPVTLVLNDSIYGTLSPATVTTDASGKASSTFTVKTKSGAAHITATINSMTVSGSVIQNIDHDSPFVVSFTHPNRAEVASAVPFSMSVTDRWGNRIDNRTGESHGVNLHVNGPAPNDCNFVGYGHDISPTLDANGNVSVNVKLTSKKGINYVSMDSFGSINDKIESIEAVATGIPFFMTGSISDGGVLPANAVDRFTINYFLYDVYGNPVQNRSIWVSTNLTDELTPKLYTTNSLGQVQMTYGPKISLVTANITATAADNSSVRNNLIARFVSSNVPTNLLLVVTPQTMASRDTHPSTTQEAKVVAILTDDWGNPVTTGEDITFNISGISTAPNNAMPGPSFELGSQILTKTIPIDPNGNAILTFYPGSFIEEGQPGYVDGATGLCTVSATAPSSGISAIPVLVEWKNFAYLSVVVNVTPRTVIVNETIDVTLRVTGDGYKMVGNPITVVLDMDTTSNMNAVASGDKENVGGNGLKRFPNSKIAAKYFVGSLNASDQVGLVTYGEYSNNVYWQLITNTSYNHDLVNSSVDSLIESGGLDISIRESVHEAVTRITSNPLRPANEVGAIITIGDSSYKAEDFAPMVQETWTNNGIRIYSILYVSSVNNCDGNYAQAMEALTTAAHGQFYCNASLEDVKASFDKIRQNLSEIAGVNTSMDLDFEHVTVNSDPTWSGQDVFDYVVVDDGMASPASRTTIVWPNNTRTFENQTDDWNDDFRLNFTIGTIKIKQSWETTFRLKVKQEGTIDLFGPGSTISYNDMPGSLDLPTTLIEAINNTIPQGLSGGMLEVSNLAHGDITNYVPLTWNLQYKGFATATETMWYSFNNGTWVQFGTVAGIPPTIAPDYLPYTHHAYMDITKLPPGYYQIKVKAFAPDSPDNEKIIDVGYVGNSGVYIKLE
jgi:hypothetical protein